ncbi:unnamed protein product, partial [Laminaria digitata]
GGLQLPRDGLESVSEQLRSVTDLETHLIEERRLRPNYVPPSDSDDSYGDGWGGGRGRGKTGGKQQGGGATKQPWFARNVVDHR